MTNHTTGFISSATAASTVSSVPAILTQTEAHESRSDQYCVLTTMNYLNKLSQQGFEWKLIKEERARKAEYKNKGTHIVQLTHPDLVLKGDLGREIKPTIYIRNSYHGRTSFKFDFGVFRFYCTNGLILGNVFESIRQRHIGIDPEQIEVDGVVTYFNEKIVPYIENLQSVRMSESEQLEFARLALAERFRLNEGFVGGEHAKLLTSHRSEDHDATSWNVLNRVQENLGLSFRQPAVELKYTIESKDENGATVRKERSMSSKALGNIKEVVYMNRKLFDLMGNVLETRSETVATA